MDTIPDELTKPLTELLFSIADDKLMLGHRASDWTGLAPILEEDIAFSAISQEEIAHASALYVFLAPLLNQNPDALAFARSADQFRCAELTELTDDFDWARAIVRQFFCDHLDVLRLERLARSSHKPLAALSERLRAEETVHVDHADTWMVHLGGSSDGKTRMQAALDALGPRATMLLEPSQGVERLEKAGLYPGNSADLFARWSTDVGSVIQRAGLHCRLDPPPADAVGGRRGQRSDDFAALLDEMSEVYRIEPLAAW
ncbi:MAG: 1,2-phenylacetyl-CoA epoxidase subunit PaaC [Phycisphaerae bacterium]